MVARIYLVYYPVRWIGHEIWLVDVWKFVQQLAVLGRYWLGPKFQIFLGILTKSGGTHCANVCGVVLQPQGYDVSSVPLQNALLGLLPS